MMCRRIAAVLFAVVANCAVAWAQTNGDTSAVTYFSGKPPSASELSRLPSTARDVLVAKVRVRSVYWLGGRHPWDPPGPHPRAILGTQMEILEVLSGNAAKGSEYIALFGERGTTAKFAYPATPAERGSEHHIAAYVDEHGERRLLAFPLEEKAYEQWEREKWAYESERGRPGARP